MFIFFLNSRIYLKYSLIEAEFDLYLRGKISMPAFSSCNKSSDLDFDMSVIKKTLYLLDISLAISK